MKQTLRADMVLKAFDSVHRAAATDDTRSHMACVLLHISNVIFAAVASNGHLMAKWQDTVPKTEEEIKWLIPNEAVKDLIRNLKRYTKIWPDAEITFAYDGDKMNVDHPKFSLRFELLNRDHSPYPDYSAVIPKKIQRTRLENGYLGFSGQYLVTAYECFKAVTSKDVILTIGIIDELSPIVFSVTKVPELMVVVMPART